MTSIRQNPLYDDVLDILKSGRRPVFFIYTAEIDVEGVDKPVIPIQIRNIDVKRQFHAQIADETLITLRLERAQYDRVILPNREKLVLTLFRQPVKAERGETSLKEKEDDQEEAEEKQFWRYKAILVNAASSVLKSENAVDTNVKDTAHDDFKEVTFQLVHPALEKLWDRRLGDLYQGNQHQKREWVKNKTRMSGIFRQNTPKDVLRYLLSSVNSEINAELENGFKIDGVDMIEPDNTQTYNNFIIGHDTPILKIAQYIQQKYGIYDQGLGFYLFATPGITSEKHGMSAPPRWLWYIYPEFKTDGFEQRADTLTIINVPEQTFTDIDRTYYVERTQTRHKAVVAIATGEVQHQDQSEYLQINDSSGTRFAHAQNVLGHPNHPHYADQNKKQGIRSEHKPKGESWQVQFDFQKHIEKYEIQPREDQFNSYPMNVARITANPHYARSKVAARQGQILRLEWQNANPDLVYPGMPTKLRIMLDTEVDDFEGIVLAADYDATLLEPDVKGKQFRCDVILTVFVVRLQKQPTNWLMNSPSITFHDYSPTFGSASDLGSGGGEIATDN